MNISFTPLLFVVMFSLPVSVLADNHCSKPLSAELSVISSGWSRDYAQQQSYSAEQTGLTAADLSDLQEQWAYVFDGAVHPRSKPALTSQALFMGSESGKVYALDEKTGCEYWQFQADAEVRTAISIAQVDERWLIFFGDMQANAYALDALTGTVIWKKELHTHSKAIITGSPVYYQNHLYVPVSSLEVKDAANPFFSCCTFVGALVSLNAGNGEEQWRFNTIAEENKPSYRNIVWMQQYGPAGVAIWSAPTIDEKRQRIYIGTGQNYSYPSTENADAIIALDIETGKVVWRQQTVQGDIWNAGCMLELLSANCPDGLSVDYDFGAPPVLVTRTDGKDVIVAGQKSGMVFAFDPDEDGKLLWSQSLGRGGILGGVHWGIAASADAVYVPISDLDVPYLLTYPDQPRAGLNKLDIFTGTTIWHTPAFFNCKKVLGWGFGCRDGLSQAITVIPGAVLAGGLDGVLRAYDDATGKVIWRFDSKAETQGVNGLSGEGGTLDAPPVLVANGKLYFNSGYGGLLSVGGDAGNVFRVLAPANMH